MPPRAREPPPPLSLRCNQDDLDAAKFSQTELRFVARLPHHMDPQQALPRFASAVGDFVRRRTGDEVSGVTTRRAYFPMRQGSQRQPTTVVQALVCAPEVRDILLGSTDSRGWVELPGWGGHAAVYSDSGSRVLHLYELPIGFDVSLVEGLLRRQGVQVLDTQPLMDDLTGLPRADAARLRVAAATNLPDSITLLLPDDSTLATIQVRYASSLPPAPAGEAPRASYAAAAAGQGIAAGAAAGGAAAVGVAAARPAPAAGAAAAAAAGGGITAAGPASAAGAVPLRLRVPAARQPSPGRGGGSPRQRGSSGAAAAAAGSPSAARQATPPRRAADQPPEVPSGAAGSAAGSPSSPGAPAASKRLRTENRFSSLSDSDDMDADPDTLLAQQPADPAPPHAAPA